MSSSVQEAPEPPSVAPPLLLPLPLPPLLLLLLLPALAPVPVADELLKHAGIKKAGSEAKPTAAPDTPTRTIIGIFTSAPLSLNEASLFRRTRGRKRASHHHPQRPNSILSGASAAHEFCATGLALARTRARGGP